MGHVLHVFKDIGSPMEDAYLARIFVLSVITIKPAKHVLLVSESIQLNLLANLVATAATA